MLKNISYKNLFVSLVIIFAIIITFVVYLVFDNIKKVHIHKLSKDSYISERLHKEDFIKEYFTIYNNLLTTLSQTKAILQYKTIKSL